MKIVLCGGGSGGHFYPLIAIAEAIREKIKDEKIIQAKIYYLAPEPYNAGILFDHEIEFRKIYAGKIRRYWSIKNVFDVIKTSIGFVQALIKVFSIFPDVILSKGGMMSLPVVLAGRILGIPIIIHESDSVPGRANLFAGKFAKKIAISFSEAGQYFDPKKTAWTGNPIRNEIINPISEGAREYLKLENNTPVVLFFCGSIGAKKINNTVLEALPELIENYQVIHQTGKLNFEEVVQTANVTIAQNKFASRYHPYDYLNALALRMSSGVADLIVSRGGSTIFEISAWGIPSIIIPITDSNGDHQRKNAYNYARFKGSIVIEENNLTTEVLLSEIKRVIDNPALASSMRKGALSFAKTDAAYIIANEVIQIALKHEK